MKAVRTSAVIAALTLALAACGSSGSGNAASATFTMVLSADPGNLDPDFTVLGVTLQTDRFLYDSLVSMDSSGRMVQGLAASWTGDTKMATYTLRKNITCSDGAPLTATTVADNINFVGNPANKSSVLGLFVPPNAKATADDAAGTITVTSPTPNPFLVRSVGTLPIVCANGMKDRSMLKQGADGTGPYTLTEAVPADHYTLSLRKDYNWGPGKWTAIPKAMPTKVILKVVSNESTATNLLLAGTVNQTRLLGPDQQRLRTKHLFERDAYTGEQLWFNQASGQPTADQSVRAALTQALDLSKLGKVATNGAGKPPSGLVARGQGPCPADSILGELPSTDVASAKSVLAPKKLSLTLYYPTDTGPSTTAVAELVQQAWSAAGVKTSLKPASQVQLSQDVLAGESGWSAALIPLSGTLPGQLSAYLSGPTPPKGANFADIQNSDYTGNAQKASAQAGAAGCADWAAAENALYAQVNPVPYVDSPLPYFGNGATFELSQGLVSPTSIRIQG